MSAPTRRSAVSILLVLTAINFVNYIDRYVLNAVLEPMRLELGLQDVQSGLLTSVFMVVYMVASPLGGHLGDLVPRKYITSVAVALWSLATMASGLADDYGSLMTTRAAVGIGEAGYATIAPAVIADLFRPKERGRKLAYFYLAIPMGSALGYMLGGAIGGTYGWRAAFFVAGAPGLVLAVVALLLPEPQRGGMDDEPDDGEALVWRDALRRMVRNPAWRFNVAGSAMMTFSIGGIGAWMPTFLERVHDLSTAEAGTLFGGVTVVGGLIGTLLGGWFGDRAQARNHGGYFSISGIGLLLGAPFALTLVLMPTAFWTLVWVFGAELFLFLNTGPLNAALVECMPAGARARAVAVHVFMIHAFGDAISPPLMGLVSDASSIGVAIGLTGIPMAIGGGLLLIGARRVARLPRGLRSLDGEEPPDREAPPGREAPPDA